MTLTSRLSYKPHLRRTAVAIAMAAACAGASAALQPFTLDPSAAGLNGAAFTGDNILISDYSTVTFGLGNSFTDTGFLSVSGIQLGGSTLGSTTGLNSTYGLYFAFTGTGTTTGADPAKANTSGNFTSLTYTLYGYNGTASFGFTGNTPTETATGEVVLATGSLIPGSSFVSTNPGGPNYPTSFYANAGAGLTFGATAVPALQGFFVSPKPFYNLALTSFSNTPTEVEAFDGGFRIRQGGGSVNFASTPPVPEPETYAMLLGGLAAVGFVARRRRS